MQSACGVPLKLSTILSNFLPLAASKTLLNRIFRRKYSAVRCSRESSQVISELGSNSFVGEFCWNSSWPKTCCLMQRLFRLFTLGSRKLQMTSVEARPFFSSCLLAFRSFERMQHAAQENVERTWRTMPEAAGSVANCASWRRQASVIWLILALTRCQNDYSTFLCLWLTKIAKENRRCLFNHCSFAKDLFSVEYCLHSSKWTNWNKRKIITQNEQPSKFGFVGTHQIFSKNKPSKQTYSANTTSSRIAF